MPEKDASVDLLGMKPVADAMLVVVKATTDGAGAFLGRICLPAAEEFGLLLRDKVRAWRGANVREIEARAQQIYETARENGERYAHPRIVGAIIEHGSWEDNAVVRDMWAGLLASACTLDGRSQSNLIFVNLLAAITANQAKLIAYACEKAKKHRSTSGLVGAQAFHLTISELMDLSETKDLNEVDVELDHLRELGLLSNVSGFNFNLPDRVHLEPTGLALNFYARCQGHSGTVIAFFGLDILEEAAAQVGATNPT